MIMTMMRDMTLQIVIWNWRLNTKRKQQEDPNKQEPAQAKVCKESRIRVLWRTYLTNNEKTEQSIAKIDAIESTQLGEGSNSKDLDLYFEVLQDPKIKSRLRLVGKGVTKTDLKKKHIKSGFLQNIKTELVQQLAPTVASMIISQLQEANSGINLVIPDFVSPSIPKDVFSAPHVSEPNRQFGGTVNQVCGELIGQEI